MKDFVSHIILVLNHEVPYILYITEVVTILSPPACTHKTKQIHRSIRQLVCAGQRQMAFLIARADSTLKPPAPSVVILMPPQCAVFSVGIPANAYLLSTSGCGKPKRLSAPDEINTNFGCTVLISICDEEVELP